jgi:proteic killer suppression protein
MQETREPQGLPENESYWYRCLIGCYYEIQTRWAEKILGGEDSSRLPSVHAARINRLLDGLAVAENSADLNFPGLRLHQLSGNRRGTWSIRVSANLRLTVRLEDSEAVEIDLEDYHQGVNVSLPQIHPSGCQPPRQP